MDCGCCWMIFSTRSEIGDQDSIPRALPMLNAERVKVVNCILAVLTREPVSQILNKFEAKRLALCRTGRQLSYKKKRVKARIRIEKTDIDVG